MFKLTYSNSCATFNRFYGIKSVSCAGFLAYPNPATSVITLEFENTQDLEYLPDRIDLISERDQKTVKTVDVIDVFSKKQFKDRNKVELNVIDLPRGTYYLHSIIPKDSKLELQKIRILLE